MFRTTPAEYTEGYYPVRIDHYVPVIDSGGAGLHRGGTGIEKLYVFTGPGEFTVNDDRALISPWGIGGGRAGGRSSKTLIRADGELEELPSKIDAVHVEAGDRLVFRTAGAGGWGDPLERPPEHVLLDVERALVSEEAARRDYGVVLAGGAIDRDATEGLRATLRDDRGEPPQFDYGELPEGVTVG
jgi:N-methylhydantoinase B